MQSGIWPIYPNQLLHMTFLITILNHLLFNHFGLKFKKESVRILLKAFFVFNY